jgi:elongation factor G
MGELHLDVLVTRLQQDFDVQVNVGKPQVVYRETISQPIEVEGKFEKEIGNNFHFGQVKIKLEPLPRGAGNQFVNSLSEDKIPPQFIGAIEDGVNEALLSGIIAGYPVVDIKVSLIDVIYREGVSSELGYKIAASMGVKEGCEKARAILLEPFMSVEVVVPDEFTGEVISDLNARKGKLENITAKGKISIIKALVPLKKMFGYSTSLRSATQGRGTFTMQFSHYDQAE